MMFDYFWDDVNAKWVPWTQKVPEYIHASDRKFNKILVPTVDTVRTLWLLDLQVAIPYNLIVQSNICYPAYKACDIMFVTIICFSNSRKHVGTAIN